MGAASVFFVHHRQANLVTLDNFRPTAEEIPRNLCIKPRRNYMCFYFHYSYIDTTYSYDGGPKEFDGDF